MVAVARKNMVAHGLSNVIELKVGDASRMPFVEGSFDAVVSTGSIHHLKDPVAGLNDVYRVLKPGGHALMYDLVSDTPLSVLNDMAREFGRPRMALLWLHSFEEPFYTCKGFESLARFSSFKRARTRFVGVFFLPGPKKGFHVRIHADPVSRII
jgi:ubiquinone/menaquinone biosynthesis C-methylase UbiE